MKVPGRLGMLLTLCLISTNIYVSVDAPPQRGLSYIEIWFVGMQSMILLAIIEYSIILGMKKYRLNKDEKENKVDVIVVKTKHVKVAPKLEKESIATLAYKMDVISFSISIIFYLIFCVCYWLLL